MSELMGILENRTLARTARRPMGTAAPGILRNAGFDKGEQGEGLRRKHFIMVTCDVLFPLICDAQLCNRYTDVRQNSHGNPVRRGKPLGQIPHGSSHLSIGTSQFR